MVVYALPGDSLPPKKRHFGQVGQASCHEASSPSKRSKNESAADVLSADLLPGLMLGADGGVWHVDGLLELLTGALCSALGTDGLHSDLAVPAGPSAAPDAAHAPVVGPAHATHAASHAEPAAAPASGHQPRNITAASTTAFDFLRSNLPALTIPRPPAVPAAAADDQEDEEDDRSSVASLSAWVAGTPSRRRGSEVAAGQGSGSAGATPLSGFMNFSFAAGGFAPRAAMAAQAAAAAAPCSSCESVGSDGAAAAWPRRRLSGAGRR